MLLSLLLTRKVRLFRSLQRQIDLASKRNQQLNEVVETNKVNGARNGSPAR